MTTTAAPAAAMAKPKAAPAYDAPAQSPLLQPPPKPRPLPLRVPARRIVERDGHRRDWGLVLKPGETLHDALQPEFLGEKSHAIRAGDRIEVRTEDFGMWAELLVIASDELVQSVTTVILHGPLDLQASVRNAVKIDFSRVVVEDMGEANGWRARFGHQVLRAGFRNRAEAEKYVGEKREGAIG